MTSIAHGERVKAECQRMEKEQSERTVTSEHINLFERVCKNDPDAIRIIYNQYYLRVIGFTRRYVNEADVEDVVQETFFHVFRKAENIKDTAAFEKYLFRAAKNRCINWLRKKHRIKGMLELVMYSASLWQHATPVPDGLTNLELVLRELPDDARNYIELFYVHKRSRAEIANMMKESPSSVYRKISSSRALLLEKAHELNLTIDFQGRHDIRIEERKA
ncbi:MAG: RNA polymerase sigma factor [bacterium]|jgi:DNA-directed RNA polymerase specialized sigma24 family protein